jgi:hypothetical protein
MMIHMIGNSKDSDRACRQFAGIKAAPWWPPSLVIIRRVLGAPEERPSPLVQRALQHQGVEVTTG